MMSLWNLLLLVGRWAFYTTQSSTVAKHNKVPGYRYVCKIYCLVFPVETMEWETPALNLR